MAYTTTIPEVRDINISIKLAGILACITVLTTSYMIFWKAMSIDIYSIIHVFQVSIPGGIVAGYLGYTIGKLFESSSKKGKKKGKKFKKNPELLIDDLLLNDLDNIKLDDNK